MDIYEWPREWYKFVSTEFGLRTAALSSSGPLSPRRNTRLVYQIWTVQATVKTERGPSKWAPREAFFARLDGEVGLFRMTDSLRCYPAYNRSRNLAGEPWSDLTPWSDNTYWLSGGYVPPSALLHAPAQAGDSALVISGLPVNGLEQVLSPGDLIEIRPDGMTTTTSNLYEVVRGSPTDADGRAGVEIRPRLRQDFVANDLVVLHHAQGVFMLSDPEQGRVYRDANMGSQGFAAQEYTG